jgi:hypothetical protein
VPLSWLKIARSLSARMALCSEGRGSLFADPTHLLFGVDRESSRSNSIRRQSEVARNATGQVQLHQLVLWRYPTHSNRAVLDRFHFNSIRNCPGAIIANSLEIYLRSTSSTVHSTPNGLLVVGIGLNPNFFHGRLSPTLYAGRGFPAGSSGANGRSAFSRTGSSFCSS